MLTDALEDKGHPKRSLGVRIGDWMVDYWQEAVDFRVNYGYGYNIGYGLYKSSPKSNSLNNRQHIKFKA